MTVSGRLFMATKKDYPWLQHYDPNIKWDMEIPVKPVHQMLADTAQKHGDKAAINFLGKEYSWMQLYDMSRKMAAGLQKLGVKKGKRVGLFLPNCPYTVIAYNAILQTGATVVNYNPLYAAREIANQIEDSQTDIMVTLDLKLLYENVHKMLHETRLEKIILGRFTEMLPFPKNMLFKLVKASERAKVHEEHVKEGAIVWYEDLLQHNDSPEPVDVDPENDLAVLQYTGGTTGVPKGAMLTHANLYSNVIQCYANFPEAKEQEKMMAVLPFFHVFAMTVSMNLAVYAGMKIITLPRFDLKQSLDLINEHRPHYMAAVPAIFNAINNHPKLDKYDLSSLRFCISGGAPLPVEVKKSFEAKTGAVVVEGYGLTEASPVSHVNPPFGENIAGSIGMPLPLTIVEIIDPEDKKTPVKTGDRGEVCLRGPQVMKGYWNREEETADVLRKMPDGTFRLHTGDIGIMDKKGYTYIVDRIKDLIITNGYNVYPRNIEEAIYMHEAVEECIAAGLPDKNRGEIVKVWIKCKEGKSLDEKTLKAFLEDKLSKIEMPRKIEFRKEPLPKTMIGKLSRKDIVAEELGE